MAPPKIVRCIIGNLDSAIYIARRDFKATGTEVLYVKESDEEELAQILAPQLDSSGKTKVLVFEGKSFNSSKLNIITVLGKCVVLALEEKPAAAVLKKLKLMTNILELTDNALNDEKAALLSHYREKVPSTLLYQLSDQAPSNLLLLFNELQRLMYVSNPSNSSLLGLPERSVFDWLNILLNDQAKFEGITAVALSAVAAGTSPNQFFSMLQKKILSLCCLLYNSPGDSNLFWKTPHWKIKDETTLAKALGASYLVRLYMLAEHYSKMGGSYDQQFTVKKFTWHAVRERQQHTIS